MWIVLLPVPGKRELSLFVKLAGDVPVDIGGAVPVGIGIPEDGAEPVGAGKPEDGAVPGEVPGTVPDGALPLGAEPVLIGWLPLGTGKGVGPLGRGPVTTVGAVPGPVE